MKKTTATLLFLLIGFSVLFFNTFPNYYAFLKTPPGKIFSGQDSWFDPWDINVYVAAINFGKHHGILLQNTYTTDQTKPVFYYFVYTTAGALLPKMNQFLLYQILALAAGAALLLVIWKTLQNFLEKREERLIVFILIVFGGGLGWLFFPQFSSADLFMTGFTFLSQFQRPHEAIGVIFYLLSLILFYQKNYWSILSLTLLAFFYPFYILSFAMIAGIYSLILYLQNGDTSHFKLLVISSLVSTPFYIFYSLYLAGAKGFGGVVSQQLSTPNILEIISGYGILFFLALFAFKAKNPHRIFLLIWFWSSLILSYLPFGFARFYLRGLFYPLAILAWSGLGYLYQKYNFPRKTATLILLAVVSASSFYIFYHRTEEAGGSNPWIYYTRDEGEILSMLRPEDKVLAGYNLGNLIPAKTEASVYFGHLLQTPNASEKYQTLTRFYANMMADSEAEQFLQQAKINKVVFGPEEKNITKTYGKTDKLKYNFLKPIFESQKVTLYGF